MHASLNKLNGATCSYVATPRLKRPLPQLELAGMTNITTDADAGGQPRQTIRKSYSAATLPVWPSFTLSLLMRSVAASGMFVPGPNTASAPASNRAG